MTDTERLDWLLAFLRIEDVGDDHVILGVTVQYEALDDALMEGRPIYWDSELREIIDRTIEKECEP